MEPNAFLRLLERALSPVKLFAAAASPPANAQKPKNASATAETVIDRAIFDLARS